MKQFDLILEKRKWAVSFSGRVSDTLRTLAHMIPDTAVKAALPV
jgi:hypothetical protein